MKKLILAAVAIASVGVASAVETYSYKATVKHTYIKEQAFTRVLGVTVPRVTLYVKFNKTSTLEGYLIQDDTELLRLSATATITGAATELQPGNRCFLVVKNKNAEKDYKYARILPGVLEAKWYDPQLSAPGTSPAQGYLYIGGEVVAAYVGTTFDATRDGVAVGGYTARAFTNWQRLTPAATVPLYGIDDFFFTSAYLFGQYNQPSWANPTQVEEFGDTWMNHAGFGKAAYFNNIKLCCGKGKGSAGIVLDNLAGSLKVGIYLCSENGEDDSHTYGFNRTGLVEDQLWKAVAVNNPAPFATYNVGPVPTAMRKLDMWSDGNLDLGTTDVGTGTWSIKRTTNLAAPALTAAELAIITTATAADPVHQWGLAAPTTTLPLIQAIKGAFVALKPGTVPLFGDVLEEGAMINYSFFNAYLR